jgi:hypothetical protein
VGRRVGRKVSGTEPRRKNILAKMVTKRYKDFFWVLFFRAEAEFLTYYFVEVPKLESRYRYQYSNLRFPVFNVYIKKPVSNYFCLRGWIG